jgi:hypothetical protein
VKEPVVLASAASGVLIALAAHFGVVLARAKVTPVK